MEKWFIFLVSKGLTPNQLYLLSSIKSLKKPININVHTELRALKSGGWVNDKNQLTETGEKILQEISGKFYEEDKKEITRPIESYTDTKEMMQQYVDIFPAKKLPSGKLARVHINNLTTAFTWFFEHYSYSWSIILRATDMYVTEYQSKNYEYMRTSQYFIRKQNPDKTWQSELANYCEMVLSGEVIDPVQFTDKVN